MLPQLLATALLALLAAGCHFTSHPVEPAALGTSRSGAELEALVRKPGPVALETVIAADWEVERSGLLNLEHPKALAAGLRDGPEPIQIYFHALRHPERGLFLVDSGVERALGEDPERAAIRGIVASAMHVDQMKVRQSTSEWLARQAEPPAGVFMTHLHLDHVSGLPDVPDATPIHAGPGETGSRAFQNLVVRANIDRALAGKAPLREWQFEPASAGPFDAILDVFADGSVFALHVPGHTPGSTAYLVRTPHGPVLLVGDASHTAWGWQHGVEPGSFSSDIPRSAVSLEKLRRFAERHPGLEIRLGHQPLAGP